jgi:deoxyadenosine/deoxycytidine kinase
VQLCFQKNENRDGLIFLFLSLSFFNTQRMRKGVPVFLISLSGIIGVGKSTAIKALQKSDSLQTDLNRLTLPGLVVGFVQEPSDEWREHGHLQKFYGDPKRYALSFQIIVFTSYVRAVQTKIDQLENAHPTASGFVLIVERSMLDQLLFWDLQCDLGRNEGEDMLDYAYRAVWNEWNQLIPPISKIILCQIDDLQKAMHRIAERGRKEELGLAESTEGILDGSPKLEEAAGVTLEYLTRLDEKHRSWFSTPIGSGPAAGIPCSWLSTELAYHRDEDAQQELSRFLAKEIAECLPNAYRRSQGEMEF